MSAEAVEIPMDYAKTILKVLERAHPVTLSKEIEFLRTNIKVAQMVEDAGDDPRQMGFKF